MHGRYPAQSAAMCLGPIDMPLLRDNVSLSVFIALQTRFIHQPGRVCGHLSVQPIGRCL